MSTSGQPVSSAWNERMRLIRLRRKKERPRFTEELGVIPRWLRILCVVLWLIAVCIGVTVIIRVPDARLPELRDNAGLAAAALAGMITGVSVVVSAFLLTLGYVYRDARRRGMNAPLWTLLVFILSTTSLFLGLIIYLLVRDPLPYSCPRCGSLVGPRFNYCSNCKCDLHPSCANCKQEIAETDKFCPNCGQPLQGTPISTTPITAGEAPSTLLPGTERT